MSLDEEFFSTTGGVELFNGCTIARRGNENPFIWVGTFGDVMEVSRCKDAGLNCRVFALRIQSLRKHRGEEISFDKALDLAHRIAKSENKKISMSL